MGDTQRGMNKVPGQDFLYRRGGAYYYRRRVPLDLVSAIGISHIQFSLNTPALRIAKEQRNIQNLEWDAKFAKERAKLKHPDPSSGQTSAAQKKLLTEPLAIQLVQKYVEETDKRRCERALADPPQNSEERREAEQNIEEDLAIARDRAPMYNHDAFISHAYEEIFASVDADLDEQTYSSDALYALVKRACIEVERRALARVRDDHRHRFFDNLFDPASPPPVTVGELSNQFLALKREEAAAHKLAPKSIDKHRDNLALVREILGDEALVRDINWEACRRFCSVLAQVPPNRTKIYKGVTLDVAIARAKEEERGGLAAITQQQYLATLRELLDLAVNKDLIRTNYAKNLCPLKVDELAPDEKRKSFEIEQLKTFFSSAYYRACAEAGAAPYRHADKSWRYWFPLLALFGGMRPKEIFQMHVEDVRPTEAGTWFFSIAETTDEGDERAPELKKTTKTLTSRRQVPVHPELAKLGFLEFVKDQKKSSSDPLLFRGIRRNKYEDPAHYPLRRFREKYLKEAIDLKPRQSPYSFRHTWRDAARLIGASPDFLKAVGGWTGGTTTSDNYGSKHQPDLYAKDVARIAYQGLDLSHLYVKAASP